MIPLIDPKLEEYAAQRSRSPSVLLRELETYTRAHCAYPEMVVGALEGALLHMLVRLMGARRILEVGTFTGYSALAMAEAMGESGRIISCEIDANNARIAQSFFDRSPAGDKIEIRVAPALETIPTLTGPFDLVFIDADKENYVAYYDAVWPLMNSGALLIADNTLWSGKVLSPESVADKAIVAFNERVAQDERADTVLLPVRDGVTLVRKK